MFHRLFNTQIPLFGFPFLGRSGGSLGEVFYKHFPSRNPFLHIPIPGEVWGKSWGSLLQTLPLSQPLSARPFREIWGSEEVFFKISSFQRSLSFVAKWRIDCEATLCPSGQRTPLSCPPTRRFRYTSSLFLLTSYILPLTSYFLPLTSYLLHLTSYLLHLTSYFFCDSPNRIQFPTLALTDIRGEPREAVEELGGGQGRYRRHP